jgi:hypothetical protein
MRWNHSYNWQVDSSNAGFDWYFVLVTFPIIPYVSNTSA